MKGVVAYRHALRAKAFQTVYTLGRKSREDEDLLFSPARGPFETDIWKIKSCKGFRALAGKTQVFPIVQNHLVRNRLTHTLEVETIATLIAQVLGLNVSLTTAIALAHDVGHAPFGHLFERTVSEITGAEFRHENFGPILLQEIERKGQGVNISFEVLEGVSKHSRYSRRDNLLLPLEYSVVTCSDQIAYIFSDINDCLCEGRLREKNLPASVKFLGADQRSWVNTCLLALFEESVDCKTVFFTRSDVALAFESTSQWMYKNVYYKLDKEPKRIVYGMGIKRAHLLFLKRRFDLSEIDAAVLLATMTDSEVLVLSGLEKKGISGDVRNLNKLGFMERLPFVKGIVV